MLPVIWTAPALDDLDDILSYIAERNPVAAEKLLAQIERAVMPISDHPYLYRPGRVPGTREIVAHPNYIVVYAVRSHHIDILSVLHARRQYP